MALARKLNIWKSALTKGFKMTGLYSRPHRWKTYLSYQPLLIKCKFLNSWSFYLFKIYVCDLFNKLYINFPDWKAEAVSSHNILKLIYQGRFLHGNVTLGGKLFCTYRYNTRLVKIFKFNANKFFLLLQYNLQVVNVCCPFIMSSAQLKQVIQSQRNLLFFEHWHSISMLLMSLIVLWHAAWQHIFFSIKLKL